MRTKFYLPFIALALMATSCNSKKEAEQKGGIRLANLDQTANPRDDFYQYACGGWMKANPLTDEYSRFGSFDQLAENNRTQIKSLIEELAKQQAQPGSVAHYSLNIFSEISFYRLSLYISYLYMFSFGLNTHEISRF